MARTALCRELRPDLVDQFSEGMTVLPRHIGGAEQGACPYGRDLHLTLFSAVRTEALGTLGLCSQGSSDPTMAKLGLYQVAGDPFTVDGNLLKIAEIADDPTMFTQEFTRYVRATLAPFTVTEGQRY